MRSARIGTLDVSVVGLGCNNFGRALDQEQSAAVVHAALDAGVTHFDTASNYGDGRSESFLGGVGNGGRADAVIATKVGVPIPGRQGSGGAASDYVRKVLERSLIELGTDYVDIEHDPLPRSGDADRRHPGRDERAGRRGQSAGDRLFQFRPGTAGPGRWRHPAEGMADLRLRSGAITACFTGSRRRTVWRSLRLRRVWPFSLLPAGERAARRQDRRGGEPQGRLKMDRYQHFSLLNRLLPRRRGRAFRIRAGCSPWFRWLWDGCLLEDAVPAVALARTSPEQVVANAKAAEWDLMLEDLEELAQAVNPGAPAHDQTVNRVKNHAPGVDHNGPCFLPMLLSWTHEPVKA